MFSYDRAKIWSLCEKHGLKLFILHGSYAKGTATERSDIDIGILSKTKIDYKRYRDILNDFGEIFGEKFDPAFLNNAEPMICYHVALAGQPLYEAKRGDFSDFKVQAMGRYLDAKKFRELEKAYLKRAIGAEK
jgi:predicted nucleotidyltransferase